MARRALKKNHTWFYCVSIGIVLIVVFKLLDNYTYIAAWLNKLLGVIGPFLGAILISYILYAPCRFFEKLLSRKLKKHRKLARFLSIAIVYIIAIFAIIILLRFIIPHLWSTIKDLVNNVTYYYYHRPNSLTHVVTRKGFSINEAINAMDAIDCHREICRSISSKPYFDCRVTKVLKEAYYISIGILKHRNEMDQEVTDSQVKNILTHPASMTQILKFRRYRAVNLLLYFLHLLPANLFVRIIFVFSKLKK